jgi:hypothetical protein
MLVGLFFYFINQQTSNLIPIDDARRSFVDEKYDLWHDPIRNVLRCFWIANQKHKKYLFNTYLSLMRLHW